MYFFPSIFSLRSVQSMNVDQDFYPTLNKFLADIIMNLEKNDIADDFSNDGKIYLNNASVSLMPVKSIKAMTDFLISYNSVGPDSIDSESFVTEKLRKT